MGRLYLGAGLLIIVLPILIASFLQDVTRRQFVAIFLVGAVLDFSFLASQSDWLSQAAWDLRAPSPAPEERQFTHLLAAPPESGSCTRFVDPDMWSGVIENIVQTMQGAPLLRVRIAPNLVIYNPLSKESPGSSPAALRAQHASTLNTKDTVRFSATFRRTDHDCIQVVSDGGRQLSVPADFTNIGAAAN